jgi:hypothetical protein
MKLPLPIALVVVASIAKCCASSFSRNVDSAFNERSLLVLKNERHGEQHRVLAFGT